MHHTAYSSLIHATLLCSLHMYNAVPITAFNIFFIIPYKTRQMMGKKRFLYDFFFVLRQASINFYPNSFHNFIDILWTPWNNNKIDWIANLRCMCYRKCVKQCALFLLQQSASTKRISENLYEVSSEITCQKVFGIFENSLSNELIKIAIERRFHCILMKENVKQKLKFSFELLLSIKNLDQSKSLGTMGKYHKIIKWHWGNDEN